MKMDLQRKDRPNKPLRSFSEFVDEFGVSKKSLMSRLAKSEDAPKPRLRHHSSLSFHNSWYDPDEMRAWWKKHQAKQNEQ